MKIIIHSFILSLGLLLVTSSFYAQTNDLIYMGSGDWTSARGWSGGIIPNSTISAFIPSDATVSVSSNVSCSNLSLEGTLTILSGAEVDIHQTFVNRGGTLNIASGGQITLRGGIANAFGIQHLQIGGSIEIGGSLEVDESSGQEENEDPFGGGQL